MELTEEDQMLQAIAMSLGENVQVSGSSGSGSSSGQQASSVSKPPVVPPKEEDDEPLSKSTLGECGGRKVMRKTLEGSSIHQLLGCHVDFTFARHSKKSLEMNRCIVLFMLKCLVTFRS